MYILLKKKILHRQFTHLAGLYSMIHESGSIDLAERKELRRVVQGKKFLKTTLNRNKEVLYISQDDFLNMERREVLELGEVLTWAGKTWLVDPSFPFL